MRRVTCLDGCSRTVAVLLIDLCSAAIALLLALWIESDLRAVARGFDLSAHLLPIYLLNAAAVFVATGLPGCLWRFTGTDDLSAICRATTLAVLALLATGFVVDRLATLLRAAPLILWLTQATMLIAPRVAYASLVRRERRIAAAWRPREPVLLVGAGEACAVLLKALARCPDHCLEVVGVLDNAPGSLGRTLSGVPILGRLEHLGAVVDRLTVHGRRPHRVLLTKPAQQLEPSRLAGLSREADRGRLSVEPIPPLDRLLTRTPAAAREPHAVAGVRSPVMARAIELAFAGAPPERIVRAPELVATSRGLIGDAGDAIARSARQFFRRLMGALATLRFRACLGFATPPSWPWTSAVVSRRCPLP